MAANYASMGKIMKLFPFERKMLFGRIASFLLGGSFILFDVLFFFLDSFILALIFLPFAAMFGIWAIHGTWKECTRKYYYFRVKRSLSVQERAEIQRKLNEKTYFQIGEAIFFEEFILYQTTGYLVRYLDIDSCQCIEWRSNPRNPWSKAVIGCPVIIVAANQKYTIGMKGEELFYRDGLLEKLREILKSNNPNIKFNQFTQY